MANQKELLVAANARLLEVFKTSKQTLNSLGIGTAAIVTGFVGKIDDIRFDIVAGTGITNRADDQVINVPGQDPVIVAEKGQAPVSLFMLFDGGVRKLALPALFQSPKSTIKLTDGETIKCTDMSGEQWFGLIGSTIRCDHAGQDEDLMIPRVQRFAAVGAPLVSQPARYYTFTVTAKAETAPVNEEVPPAAAEETEE